MSKVPRVADLAWIAGTWRAAVGEAVFASDRTAFPRRITYRRVADDVLVARLEGQDEGTPSAMEFRFTRR